MHTALLSVPLSHAKRSYFHNMVAEPVFLILLAVGTAVRECMAMMETVLGRIRQLEETNEALRTELREAQELGGERYRHDRDTARRQEAAETEEKSLKPRQQQERERCPWCLRPHIQAGDVQWHGC